MNDTKQTDDLSSLNADQIHELNRTGNRGGWLV